MKKPELTDVVALTKKILDSYLAGDYQPWFDALSPNSIFVASGENMCFGADSIKQYMKQYPVRRGKVFQEEYFHVPLNAKMAIVIVKLITDSQKAPTIRISNTHSFVYQLIGQDTKLVYEHTSYEFFMADQEQNGPLPTPLNMDVNTFQFVKHLLMDRPVRDKMSIASGNQTIYFDVNTLLYVKGDGNKTELHCVDRVISSTVSLKKLKESLPDYFYQVHRSYIINTGYITSISCYEAELISGIAIPIPAASYGKVKKDLEEMLNRPLSKPAAPKKVSEPKAESDDTAVSADTNH